MINDYMHIFKSDSKINEFFEDYGDEDWEHEIFTFLWENYDVVKEYFPFNSKNVPYSTLNREELEEKYDLEVDYDDIIVIYNDNALLFISPDFAIGIIYRKNNSLYISEYSVDNNNSYDVIYTEECFNGIDEVLDNKPIIDFFFSNDSKIYIPDECMEIRHDFGENLYHIYDKNVWTKSFEVTEEHPISDTLEDILSVMHQNKTEIASMQPRKIKSLHLI